MNNSYTDPGLSDHCRQYMAARRRAMESLYRYAMESEAAQYHLMMCMKDRNWMPMPARQNVDYRSIPYPEDMEFSPRPAQPPAHVLAA